MECVRNFFAPILIPFVRSPLGKEIIPSIAPNVVRSYCQKESNTMRYKNLASFINLLIAKSNKHKLVSTIAYVQQLLKKLSVDLLSKKFCHVLAGFLNKLLSLVDYIMTALKPFSWRSGATDNLSHLIEDPILSEEDADLVGEHSSHRHEKYLNTYTHDDLLKALNKFGIMKRLHARGYNDLKIKTDTTDPFVHHFILTDKKLDGFTGDSNFVISIFTRRRDYTIREFTFYSDRNLKVHLVMLHEQQYSSILYNIAQIN